ncbi:MAG: response regulator [Verrucomicrobiota bacterium]
MIDGLAPLGVGVTDDGAQAGRLLNDGQLSGTVEAFSPVRSFTPAGGTTFKIYLPQVEPLEVVPAGVLDLPTLPRGTESILLVEADALMRNLSAGLLRRLGYSVVAVTDAMEALQGNQRRDIAKIDLLMADVVMPSMSGMELFLKVQGSFPRLRILCTSADTRKTMVAQAPADEPWQTLQKPFAPSALAYRLREVLDR